MRSYRKLGLLAAFGLLAAIPVLSQAPGGIPAPQFRGVFNPTVGGGASYLMDNKGVKIALELTVVGKEDVNGKPGVWMELGASPQGRQMYAKSLLVIDGKSASSQRTIIQQAGKPPVDYTQLLAARPAAPQNTDIRDSTDHVGTENITVPAGTFKCEHYKAKDGAWEAWISDKVTPWGLVKSVSGDTTMTLIKVITGATDQIIGTPVPLDMTNFGAVAAPGNRPTLAPQQK